MEDTNLRTEEVITRLGKMYPSPAYSFLTQVRNGTGFARDPRTADAMAMSLWPSRGLHLMGFEVKVSRQDWVKELLHPEKADEIAKYCDYWYLVVGDASIVHPGELPKTWGLIVPDKKKGLKEIVEPTMLKAKGIDRVFLGGILRNVAERTVSKDLIHEELKKAREQGGESSKYTIERLERQIKDMVEVTATFEKTSGVRISSYLSETGDIGAAVRQVLDGKHLKAAKKLVALTGRAKKIVAFLEGEVVNEWDM